MDRITYVAAFDDSGGTEPLIRLGPKTGASPRKVLVVASVFIRADLVPGFEQAWRQLQGRIAHELGLEVLPPIHMRLMWGKDRPLKMHGHKPNPFRTASFEQVQSYVAEALEIVSRFNAVPLGLGIASQSARRDEDVARQWRYLKSDLAKTEHEYLRRADIKAFKEYFKATMTPVMGLLAKCLVALHVLLKGVEAHSVDCLVDKFPTPKGFDEKEVLDAATAVCGLDLVRRGTISRVGGDDHTLAQAADVIAFMHRRQESGAAGYMEPDRVLEQIASRRPFQPFANRRFEDVVPYAYPDLAARGLALHYSVARHAVEKQNPALAMELVSVQEFLERARKAHEEIAPGVSILK